MNKEQCFDALKRIFILQNIGPEEQITYTQTILEACGWMDGLRFDAVCQELCKNLKTNWRLKPGQFKDAYNGMRKEKGWAEDRTAAQCSTCSGLKYVFTRILRNDIEHDAVKPCPTCRGLSAMPDGITELPIKTRQELDWDLMQPQWAKYALSIIQNSEWKIPDEFIQKLCLIAGKEEKKVVRKFVLKDSVA